MNQTQQQIGRDCGCSCKQERIAHIFRLTCLSKMNLQGHTIPGTGLTAWGKAHWKFYLGIAQMVWGTYFEKNCPCSKGHLLGLGGLNPCQDGLGHLCSENWSSNGICSSRSGNKVPQSARLSEGGGVQSLFGQCPNRPGIFLSGASLTGKTQTDKHHWKTTEFASILLKRQKS